MVVFGITGETLTVMRPAEQVCSDEAERIERLLSALECGCACHQRSPCLLHELASDDELKLYNQSGGYALERALKAERAALKAHLA